MKLTRELSIYLDKLIQINDIFSEKLTKKHDNISARFATDKTNFFINIKNGKILLELADEGITSSFISENKMKFSKEVEELEENDFDYGKTSSVIPSIDLYFFEAKKLSDFVSVEEYEKILRELVDFVNKSVGLVDFKSSPKINKIDELFDPKLERVLNNFSWYDGYDLENYLSLLNKRSWELTYLKQANSKNFYPMITFSIFQLILFLSILYSPVISKYFKNQFVFGLFDLSTKNIVIGSIVLLILSELFVIGRNRFVKKVTNISNKEMFSIRGLKDLIYINKSSIGMINILFFASNLLSDMNGWILDKKYIVEDCSEYPKSNINYQNIYKYHFS